MEHGGDRGEVVNARATLPERTMSALAALLCSVQSDALIVSQCQGSCTGSTRMIAERGINGYDGSDRNAKSDRMSG